MIQYLDDTGLTTLWNKIKSTFYTKTELENVVSHEASAGTAPEGGYGNDIEEILDAVLGEDTLPLQRKVVVESASGTTLSAATSTYYKFNNEVGTLAITLPAPTDLTHLTSVVFAFTTSSSPGVTFTAAEIDGNAPDIYAQDGFSIEASTTYEINAIFNGESWVLAAIVISSTTI